MKTIVFAVVVLGLSIVGSIAIAEPMNAGVTKLSGKTQSECLRTAESGLKSSGFENVSRGKSSSGQPGSSFFATDKPYYAVVFCEGDVAFVAISGPVSDKRSQIYSSVVRAIKGQ
jgi:hypothetical protein